MGTRNLTVVYAGGEYKVAQYGQWDGYPSGQGITALEFARKLVSKDFRDDFTRKVMGCTWITSEDIDKINDDIKAGKIKSWKDYYPELSRDTCAEILSMIAERGSLKLKNDIEFAADSLFCEWLWLIDLDAGTFEGYEGFNKTHELTEDDRFYFLKDKEENEYHAVKLVKKYSLDDLPDNTQFLKDFKDE